MQGLWNTMKAVQWLYKPVCLIPVMGSFIKYVHKIFGKTNISYPLRRTGMCVHLRKRSVSFWEKFRTYLMNDSYLWTQLLEISAIQIYHCHKI